jgi:putative nucleotidyltransferase with HDIG domain
MILSLTTFGGIIALKHMKKKQEFYPITLYLLISFFVVNTAVSLIKFEGITIYFWHLLWGIISCITSVVGLILLTPFVERKLNLATKQILLELLDFDNDLLKKMATVAPGTYHHSLIVGNLAESASEAVGANHLLARVGSYYHDIGKLENPQFFIENNPESTELHDKMMATESALIIRNHLNDGLALARKNNLPKSVIDIIQQHHGTSQIKFFYNKGEYLHKRYIELVKEMRRRGMKPNIDRKFKREQWPDELYNDWQPTDKDLVLIRERIRERIAQKPDWYKWYE